MKISNIKVKLLGEDLLSIINEFVKIDGLYINKINISNGIIIEGNLKKGINVEFSLKVEILELIDGKIICKLSNFKVMNLGLFRMIRSFILKKVIKDFNDKGITAEKDKISIDIRKILYDIPFVDFTLKEVFVKDKELWVDLEEINISLNGNLIKEKVIEEVEKNDIENCNELIIVNKVRDNYSLGRELLSNKLPEKTKKFKEYIFLLPDIISLIYRLLKDRRVPIKTKLILSSAIAYITLPTDIIPNNIPFIGAIDEIGVAFFALNNIINDVPMNVIIENWEGKNEIITVLKSGLEYLINFTGAKNVERLCLVITELTTL
ncbi:YkvA family protein [Clostridium cagae]|uniref:YkvA family protein n=1 Tax=Clostridium cagae TaxID=2080751 RepID=UPI003F767FB3